MALPLSSKRHCFAVPHSMTAGEGENAGKSPFAPMTINLSSQSTASNTCRIIESYLLKRRRGVLGPPVGKVCVCVFDLR